MCVHIVFLSNMSFFVFSEKNADLCAKIELKILEFSYRSNLYCMGLLEKSSGQEYFTFLSVTS